ncbi:hypothetical protein BFF93_05880 [Elizabethkingia meningoseptica]|nr:hypothetical protein BFF93_05880 [Elizabethkingia meningoseptica]
MIYVAFRQFVVRNVMQRIEKFQINFSIQNSYSISLELKVYKNYLKTNTGLFISNDVNLIRFQDYNTMFG